jgi:hypothetical protein
MKPGFRMIALKSGFQEKTRFLLKPAKVLALTPAPLPKLGEGRVRVIKCVDCPVTGTTAGCFF